MGLSYLLPFRLRFLSPRLPPARPPRAPPAPRASLSGPPSAPRKRPKGFFRPDPLLSFLPGPFLVEQPEFDPVVDIEPSPEGGKGGHVVRVHAPQGFRRDRPQCCSGIRGKPELDDEHPGKSVPCHRRPDVRGNGSQVLPRDPYPVPVGLEGEDGVELLGRVPDVGPLPGGPPRRDPEESVQAHHMVDPPEPR